MAPPRIATLTTTLPDSQIEAKPTRVLVPAKSSARVVEVLAPDAWRTTRLLIRPILLSDREKVVALLASNRAYLAQGLNVHEPAETDLACFERLLNSTRSGEATGLCVRRVCTLHDGTVVGMVHLMGMQLGLTPRADAGWWIAHQFAGNGLATEAVTALATFALADRPKGLGLVHIEAEITQANIASQRVAAAAGFAKLDNTTSSIQVNSRWLTHTIWRRTV